jgi:hypothetical protein
VSRHRIYFDLQQLQKTVMVLNKDVEFEVYARQGTRRPEKLFGTLKISRGSLDWRPANTEWSRVLSWELFAQLAEARGRKRIKR